MEGAEEEERGGGGKTRGGGHVVGGTMTQARFLDSTTHAPCPC